MTTLAVIWVLLILALVVAAVLFLIGALSVERTQVNEHRECICTQTRWAVYADIDCPIHGEPSNDLKG